MTNEEKTYIAGLVKNYVCSCCGCNYDHILKALDRIEKTGAYKEFFKRGKEYKDEAGIDDDRLFARNGIDDSIKYLNELKEAGWTHIEERWTGYETNFFVAYKYVNEPDYIYKSRIADLIKEYIPGILEEEKKVKDKLELIEQLRKEINELRNKK